MSRAEKNKIAKKKFKTKAILICISIFIIMSISVIYASTIYRGDINGDGIVNYADVSLLESHLIHSNVLTGDELKRADMNGDGNVTVTDLTLMIQKIEKKLEYEVTIIDIKPNTYYPNQNDDIVLSFNADVSYGGIIDKVVINGNRVKTEINNSTGLYEVHINVGDKSGIKDYHITSVELKAGQEIKVDYNVQIDILKKQPIIKNYVVREDTENSKLNISFDIEDEDNAFVSGDYSITQAIDETAENSEDKEIEGDVNQTGGKLQVGKNNIEFTAKANKKYDLMLCIQYDLDSNELKDNPEDHSSVISDKKVLQIITDYEFKLSDVATYKIVEEDDDDDIKLVLATEFDKGEKIAVRFNNSINSTQFIPVQAVINGKIYDLNKEETTNIYETIVDGFEEVGNLELKIEKVILENGKQIEVDNTVALIIAKSLPIVDHTLSRKNVEEKTFNSMVYVKDIDNAITKITVSLYDENKNIIAENLDYTNQLKNTPVSEEQLRILNVNINLLVEEDGKIKDFLMADKYIFEISADYSLIEGNEKYTYTNKKIYDEEFETSPIVNIKNVSVSNEYPEKGENVRLTYQIETNKKTLPITGIMVNNTNCRPIETEDENGNTAYYVEIDVGEEAGIQNLETTEFIFEGGLSAKVTKTTQIDVLRDIPDSEAFTQKDDIENRKVTLTANIIDPDNAFISGIAELFEKGKEDENAIASKTFDAENITFEINNLEIGKEYTLIAKMTYDRDSDRENGLNLVENKIFRRRPIQLIADYNLTLSNIKTYNEQKQTKYFNKSENIILGFNSSSSTTFYPVKVVVKGQEYELTKQGEEYRAILPGYGEAGPQDIIIEKVILNNTKEIEVTNSTMVGILKNVPTVTNFGYTEKENGEINVVFQVNDEERAIKTGNIVIYEGKNIVKSESLTSTSNGITFAKKPGCDEYIIKIIANYDLDSDRVTNDENEYLNQELLVGNISTSQKRLFEVKDITGITLYRNNGNIVDEITSVSTEELKDLSNYIVKVRTMNSPNFYAEIEKYEETNDNKLEFTLKYEDAIQYKGDTQTNKIKVTYGENNNGRYENRSFKSLVDEINSNTGGTITLTQDYDASVMQNNENVLIADSFTGKIDGNGHKITGITKPLFNNIQECQIENLVLENVSLSGANSLGTIANTATNSTISNVHVKGLKFKTGANSSGGIVGSTIAGTIEKCSVTGLELTTSLHIRIGGIVGNMQGNRISNCYVEGAIVSNQNKDGNGIGGILGNGVAQPTITIENCITKIHYTSNVSPRLNGDIIGLTLNSTAVLRNNVSLSSGTNFYSINGNAIHKTSINNYELENSGLTSNASGETVKTISKEGLTPEFFKDMAKFDESIWELTNVSYDEPPHLKDAPNSKDEQQSNKELYIPEYDRISKITGFNKSKEIAYHNLQKLMPFYDSKYLVVDGAKIANDDILNTKIIKHIIPYSNGKMMTYLTSSDYNEITNIKVVFKDYTMQDYQVKFKEWKQNIAIYQIGETEINYAYSNYTINEKASIVNAITDYIKTLEYTKDLDPLTQVADSRLYRDHYNQVLRTEEFAKTIAMQLLQNDENSLLTLNNETLNNRIKQELIDSGKLDKILYAYTYIHRWYQTEIGGSKVSDIILFEGKMYSDTMTLDNLVNEVLTGNLGTNVTSTFYVNNLKKYTGSSSLGYFFDYIIRNIGGYEDTNDWFTEYFSSIGVLSEIPVTNHPEIEYRAWHQVKRYSNFILPLTTLPKDSGYIISGAAHLQVGAQRVYHANPTENKATIKNIVAQHSRLVRSHFDTLAGTFDVGRWNNYCIMVYDCCKTITGYKTSYIPGTNIPIGTSPVCATQRVGTNEPFHKNFNEAVGAWQYGSAAGVGNTAGFLWFIATPGLTNYDTWTHEFEHALYDKIMLFQRGTRVALEDLTQGNIEQRENWSNNTINGYDVGPYYFNTSFNLNKEGFGTQNLTPERINTREKLENYYKGQQNAIDLLDYISAKAFIKLTPEEQAKIATRISQSGSWTSWGRINADQAKAMNLTTLESLWDNKIILRPENAWGISVRGLVPLTGQGTNDYGYESVWVTRWYITHNDNGQACAVASKRNFFEMLGYGGVDAYVLYGSRQSKTDLDAIQKITKAKTGTAMDWKQYKFSRYEEIENTLRNNKYIDAELMIDQFTNALKADAKSGSKNITSSTNLRKTYYHYLKRTTNDFVADPYGTDMEITHIKTARELLDKINSKPYGYYILDNDIDFTGITDAVTSTFMGTLDGNGHKIIGNTNSIFNKIRYGYVKNLKFEKTNFTNSSIGILAKQTQYSVLDNIQATDVKVNFAGRNEISVLGGAVSTVTYNNCSVERKLNHVTTVAEFAQLMKEDPSGIFSIDRDIDFTGFTGTGETVVNEIFTGIINGNGHTISNLTGKSLFANFRGKVENLNIRDFTNVGANTDNFRTAFAQNTFNATFKNMEFENITIAGANNIAVVSGMDGRNNANSVFENISIKNANVTGKGVYVSTFVGRKWGGSMKNIFIQGTMEVETTENGGLVGALQSNCIIENIITDVDINKPKNTYSNIANSVFNASMIGNAYAGTVKNSIAFGNMTGYTAEQTPYKFVGSVQNSVVSYLTNCYEVQEEQGNTRVTDATDGKLNSISRANLNEAFYENLGYDRTLWDYSTITENGYPELK